MEAQGFKINEAEREARPWKTPNAKKYVFHLYATKICQKLLSKRVTAVGRGNVMLKD